MRLRRTALVFPLLLALCAGPLAAACADCCPERDAAQAPALTLPDCCGGCAPSVDRTPDSASPVIKSTIQEFGYVALINRPVPRLFAAVGYANGVPVAPSSRSAPPASLAPLRL